MNQKIMNDKAKQLFQEFEIDIAPDSMDSRFVTSAAADNRDPEGSFQKCTDTDYG